MTETNCPNCNSLQPFSRQSKTEDGVTKVFIRCSTCHWSYTLFEGTEDEARLRSRITKLKTGQIKGVPVGRQLDRQKKRLAEELVNGSS